jgi:hypothetical protein
MPKTYLKTFIPKVKTYDSCYKVYGIILTSQNESFIKIGATTNLKTRLQNFIKYGYKIEIIFVSYFNNIKKQLEVEKMIHRYLSVYKYTPSISFDGKTECFDLSSLLLIKEII